MTQVDLISFSLQSDLLSSRATASRFDPHLHSTYSIVALRRGAAEIRSARWSGIAQAGDVFFFNPFEIHSATCRGDNAEYQTLYPSRAHLGACLGSGHWVENLDFKTGILKGSASGIDFIGAVFSAVMDRASVQASLRRMLRECTFSPAPIMKDDVKLAGRACALIQEDCTHPITTEELAKKMGVHRSHLVRAFSSSLGMAPQTYMRQIRIAKAWELICAGKKLSEVALMLDFSDQSHFTREFKKVYGVSPGVLSRDIARLN